MTYPTNPGHKVSGTSAESAAKIAGKAPILREKCLAALQGRQMTADEVAEACGETILAIRPRMSELKRAGEIMDSGDRRPNVSGHRAIVWKSRSDPLAWLC